MHNLWTTSSPHAIFDHSYKTAAKTEEGCRAVHFKGRLYCAYIDGLRDLDGVKFISRTSNVSLWSEPGVVSDIPARSDPCIFVFKDQLHVIYASTQGSTLLLTLDEASGLFVLTRTLDLNLDGTPSVAVLEGRLQLFHHVMGSPTNLWCRSTLDLKEWNRAEVVKSDGVYSIATRLDSTAIVYQRLIHLIYKDAAGGFYLLKHDGSRQWTRAQLLLRNDYPDPPAAVVHNGLLKLFFNEARGEASKADASYDVHQYGYDGNVLGPAIVSTGLGATNSVGAAVQDGVLNILYRGKP
ncbi:hypothetical protein [Pseudomonas japonica]|uniref:BNR repeat-containing family member n=1 Tax=Pseudomonas japonica TaxID=256466 RepID=A0A239HSB4_9PSED|nr:hypothetical protein [Pseudomonas japonica]SNS83968.1 hypothetical protein SAMN05444352_11671 [Pseudomonas japonica]